MSASSSAYLEAMGIDQWVLRNAAPTDTPDADTSVAASLQTVAAVAEKVSAPAQVSQSDALESLEPLTPTQTVPVQTSPEPEPETPAFSFAPARLPSFAPQQQGRFLLVCAPALADEGQGSAFEGEAAKLFDAMLGATQWPKDSCVLADSTEDIDALIAHTRAEFVIALGDAASQALLDQPVAKARQTAYPHESPCHAQTPFVHGGRPHSSGAKLYASYHPVQVQADPKQFKRPIWEDLKLVMAEAEH